MRTFKSCVPILLTTLVLAWVAVGCYPPSPMPVPEPPSLTPTRVAKSAPPTAALSLDQLQNGAYLSQLVMGGKVVLKDGAYALTTGSGATQKIQVTLVEPVALGDLNGDGAADAAVILAANTGGSGVFAELHAVVNDAGQPKDFASVPLGDRIQVKSVVVREGAVILSLVTQGPQDPMCCPTQAVTQTYQLKGDQLALASVVQQPTIRLAAPIAVSPPITVTGK